MRPCGPRRTRRRRAVEARPAGGDQGVFAPARGGKVALPGNALAWGSVFAGVSGFGWEGGSTGTTGNEYASTLVLASCSWRSLSCASRSFSRACSNASWRFFSTAGSTSSFANRSMATRAFSQSVGLFARGRGLVALHQNAVEHHPVLHEVLDRQRVYRARRTRCAAEYGGAERPAHQDLFVRVWHIASRGHGTQNGRECDPAPVTRITA